MDGSSTSYRLDNSGNRGFLQQADATAGRDRGSPASLNRDERISPCVFPIDGEADTATSKRRRSPASPGPKWMAPQELRAAHRSNGDGTSFCGIGETAALFGILEQRLQRFAKPRPHISPAGVRQATNTNAIFSNKNGVSMNLPIRSNRRNALAILRKGVALPARRGR